ncbi:MAG: RNA polymerase sigma factor [Bacteroidota bacterium]
MEEWDTIYKNNASKLLGVCRRYVKDHELAEDLMHNAFITAINKSETYSGKGLFEGWLRKITINTVLLYLRKNKNTLISERDSIENYSEMAQEDKDVTETQRHVIEEANFSRDELLEVVDLLPEHHKMVFNLYVVDGYKHKEIGEMLNISAGTSKSHLARARKKIQQLLFEKAKKKNEKKRGIFFLLFFSRENYIDKLYKDAFTSFEILPQKQTLSEAGSRMINTFQKRSLIKKIIGNKMLLVPIIVGIVVFLGLIIFLFLNSESRTVQDKNTIEIKPTIIEKENVASPSFGNTAAEEPVSNQVGKHIKQSALEVNITTAEQVDSMETKLNKLPAATNEKTSYSKKSDSVVIPRPIIIHKKIIQRDTIIQKVPVND